MKPVFKKLIDRPHKRSDTLTWVVLYIIVVGLMGFLPAIVDWVQHGGETSTDTSITVGIVNAFTTALLFGALLFYNVQLRKALTRERGIEASRKNTEAKYRELFKDSLDTVFIMASDGDLIDINPAGVKLLGYDSEEQLMQMNLERDLAVKRDDVGHFFHKIEKSGAVSDIELELRCKDGAVVTVNINASVVRDDDGKIEAYRGLMRDVTDKKYLERQVMSAQRMESIGKLASSIAHRFNNVITAIQGYAELAAGEVPPDSKAAVSLKEITSAAGRAEHLTRELLVFSRQQRLTPRPLNINQLVDSSRELMDHITGGDVSFSVMLNADPAIVRVDSASIENMLLNMVMYSRERIRGSGEIKIITGNADIGDEYLRQHPDAHPGTFLTLIVEDSGPMVPPDKEHGIFEPFNGDDGAEEAEGSGLEMSAVYGIVLRHDGWVDIDSTPERTRFTFYLPLSGTLVELGPVLMKKSILELQGQGQKLLIVEDEDTIRYMAEKMLANNGYEVFTANNASEAFRIYAREKGEIDAVIADIIMPGESGISLAEHLAEHNQQMPIILTSGHETTVDEWQSIQEHGYYFLPKPYRLTDLLREISKAFNSN